MARGMRSLIQAPAGTVWPSPHDTAELSWIYRSTGLRFHASNTAAARGHPHPWPGQNRSFLIFTPQTMRRLALSAAAFVTLAGSGLTLALHAPAAHAQSDDDAKIEARVGAWGRNCKNAIASKFNAKSMADVEVSLSASLRAGIDAGEITLKEIKRSGLSFDFRVHHVPGKDPEGYCNTDGQGNVDEIRNMHK